MKFTVVVIIVVLLLSSLSFSMDGVRLEGLMKPNAIFVENGFIYITEGAIINVYSEKDFKFIRKFGKLGEGPKEFKTTSYGGTGLSLDILPDKILVSSVGKLSIFSLLSAN
jgi:hypothetical protein